MNDFQFLHSSFDSTDIVSPAVNTNPPELYLVEDDKIFGKTLKKFLEKKLGLKINYFTCPTDCILALEAKLDIEGKDNQTPFCLVSDISFAEGGADGLLLVDLLKEKGHHFVPIVMTGFASIETAIMATKKGVFHYLTKPFELNDLASLVIKSCIKKLGYTEEFLNSILQEGQGAYQNIDIDHRRNKKFKVEPPKEDDIFCGMVGRSKSMKNVFERIKKVSSANSTILISGPSGTGKELIAEAIHKLSTRKENRMVSVNCGAIPGELLESELFGHVKGAFTGAISDRLGRFEQASSSSIFLDEIGDMPLLLQVKILRVLQSREIEKVGGSGSTKIDVRIITATHRDLEASVKEGNFREDLFYRLNVIPIKVPALSERREDIPLLISYFLSRFVSADGRNGIQFDDQALDLLVKYDWPGNVRELENLMERLVILKGGGVIKASDLPAKFLVNSGIMLGTDELISLPEEGINLKNTLVEIENSLIRQALEKTKGNKNRASKLLQMNRTTLIEKMKKKGLLESNLVL